MAKVLLIYPVASLASPQMSPPLSILHVGESIRRFGHEVRYFDERWDPEPNMDWPDVVGVSSMTGHQLEGAIKYMKLAKAHGKKTVFGGIHPTSVPEQCIAEDYVDVIVVSEGELAMLDAIEAPINTIVDRRMLKEEDMVSPVSEHTLKYFEKPAETGDTILLTSRGCPFRCGFCYIQNFFGRSWQSVGLERWKKDILFLKEHVGMDKLEHGDDWPGKMNRILEIVKFLWDNDIEYRPSIRAHQIDDEAAKMMAEMGIKHVSIGMETGNARMLKLTKKDITKEHQTICAEALAKYGIWPLYYWITGFPTETIEEINETLDQAETIHNIHKRAGGNCTQNFYAYTALPGSPLYDLADKEMLPTTMEAWSKYSLNQTHDARANALYHIGGLRFHMGKGDKTDRNFPGLKRLLVAPFEASAYARWRFRYFDHYYEKAPFEMLLKWTTTNQMNELSNLGQPDQINSDDRVSTIRGFKGFVKSRIKEKLTKGSSPTRDDRCT